MRRRHRTGVALAIVLVLLLSACSSSSEELAPLDPPEGEATTTATIDGEQDQPASVELDEAQVSELWEKTLGVFEAIEDERDERLAAIADQVPEEATRQIATLNFITGQEIDLTSNAVFTPGPDNTITITDCADSSGTSVLGPTTAGFRAVSALSPDGVVHLTEIEAVSRCVQENEGSQALNNYASFVAATEELWTDPRPDNPAIGRFATEKAANATRDFLNDLEQSGSTGDVVVNIESVIRDVEIVNYLPEEITLRDCRHGDETFGTFNGEGERIDDLVAPWRDELVVRMLKVEGEWLFDEIVNRIPGDCQMGTSSAGLRLL